MNKFIKNLDNIRPIARRFVFTYKHRFQEDELINAAYIGFLRAKNNNPELVDSDCFKVLFRAKRDMMDYIRVENETRNKHQLNFIVTPFIADGETDMIPFEQQVDESSFKEIDDKEYLENLLNTASLTDVEWHIIQGYFYDDKNLKTLGQEINRTESTMCNKKKKLIEKLQFHSKKSSYLLEV